MAWVYSSRIECLFEGRYNYLKTHDVGNCRNYKSGIQVYPHLWTHTVDFHMLKWTLLGISPWFGIFAHLGLYVYLLRVMKCINKHVQYAQMWTCAPAHMYLNKC